MSSLFCINAALFPEPVKWFCSKALFQLSALSGRSQVDIRSVFPHLRNYTNLKYRRSSLRSASGRRKMQTLVDPPLPWVRDVYLLKQLLLIANPEFDRARFQVFFDFFFGEFWGNLNKGDRRFFDFLWHKTLYHKQHKYVYRAFLNPLKFSLLYLSAQCILTTHGQGLTTYSLNRNIGFLSPWRLRADSVKTC